MDTSFTELIAKPSIDVADNSPVNRTDNCLLSDCSILPDSSVFDPYHHTVTFPAQPGYLPEQFKFLRPKRTPSWILSMIT